MTQPNISATQDIEVKRNDISLTFTPKEFKRGDRKKDGIKYPGLEVTPETLPQFIQWMGEQDFYDFLNPRLGQLWITVYDAVVEPKPGVLQPWSAEDNKSMLEKLSTRGESKAVIDAKVKALIADLNNPEMLLAMGQPGPAQADALQKFMKISADLKKFSDILESKKRVRTGDEDDDAVEAAATTQPA